MNALKLLRKQHEEIRELLHEAEKAGTLARQEELRRRLAADLVAHLQIEEELFYPFVDGCSARARSQADEGVEAHVLTGMALWRLIELEPGDERYPALVKVIREVVEHHLREEEETLFPEVEAHVGGKSLKELGEVLVQRYDALATLECESLLTRYPRPTGPTHPGRTRRTVESADLPPAPETEPDAPIVMRS